MATSESHGGAADPVTVGGEYWDAQLRVFDALESGAYDLVVFRVGYAGGKTLTGCDWIHQTAVTVPGSDNLVMAPDYAKGGPATYKTFFDRLPGDNTVPDEGGDPENSPIVDDYNRNEKRLTYANRSVARLGSADKWNRYAGSEFNAIYCDEPAHYDTTDLYDLVEMLTSRQRTQDGPNVMLWTSTGNGFNQYYDITERRVAADGESALTWADRMRVIVGDSRNNPYLPADAQEKLRRQFAGTDREAQALAGGFAAAQGRVYNDFTRNRHVVDATDVPDLLDGTGWRVYGYDAGWDDPRVMLEIGRTAYDQLLVVDEFYESGSYVEDITGGSRRVQHTEDGENHDIVDDPWLGDKPAGDLHAEHEPSDYGKFRDAGLTVYSAEKALDTGITAVRKRLDWREDPKGRPGLLVSDACVSTIREFQDYQEDHVGTSTATDHAMDALRYAIVGVDEVSGQSSGVTYSGDMTDLF
jgi:hypothetical protein